MGGNALKSINVETKRVYKDEFESILRELHNLFYKSELTKSIYIQQYQVLPCYRTKEDFGDMDILCVATVEDIIKLAEIMKLEGSRGYTVNDTVVSVDYREFQIDFITCKIEEFENYLFYYSYNDVNNFIGKVAFSKGLHFGTEGLVYEETFGNKNFKYPLLKKPIDIYTFLGYDYEVFENGFDTLEDIFNFVISSPYFDSSVYSEDRLDARNRVRNKKRKNYQLFKDFLSNLEFKEKYINPQEKYTKEQLFDIFDETDFEVQYYQFQIDLLKEKQVSSKFNGKWVMKVTHLEGKELGKVMSDFANYIESLGSTTFKDYLRLSPKSAIRKHFINFFKNKYSNGK